MPSLVLVRGLPGSGKSTYAKTKYPNHHHYEPDSLFCDSHGRYTFNADMWPSAVDWVLKLTDNALSAGADVVISEVLPGKEDIEPFLALACYHGAKVEVIDLDSSYGSIHHVPYWVVKQMRSRWIPWQDLMQEV